MKYALAVLLAILVPAALAHAGIFDPGGRPADRAVVLTERSVEIPASIPHSPMLALLSGVVAELSADDLVLLRSASTSARRGDPASGAIAFAVVRLSGPKVSKDVELLRDDKCEFYARDFADQDHPKPLCLKLDAEKMRKLTDAWLRYRGTFELAKGQVAGDDFELAHPYTPGWWRTSKSDLAARLLRGRTTKLPEPARHLEDERFFVRLPKQFEARHAAGLLVWVNAGTSEDLPDVFSSWLDQADFIMIGAVNIGNSRPAPDRYQLAHDMVETARREFLIDEERVYVTGISGGGRISSHLWMGWPETFRGAAPIVGLGFYEPIPAGGNRNYAPDYDKPEDAQLQLVLKHHIATISGPNDMNYPHIKPCTELMRLHGFQARFFDVPNMGHEMPPAATFSDAMEWVDTPGRLAARDRVEHARTLLDQLPVEEAARVEQLTEVTRVAPWTKESWLAVKLLKGEPDTAPR